MKKIFYIILSAIMLVTTLQFTSCKTAKMKDADEKYDRGEYYAAAETYRKIYNKLNRKEDLFTIELSNYLSKIKNKDTDFAQKLTDVVVDKAMDDAEKIVKADPFFKRAETLV